MTFIDFLLENKKILESNPYQKQSFGLTDFQNLFKNTVLENDSISINDWMIQTNYIKNTDFICMILKYIYVNINPSGLFPTSSEEKCFISTSASKNKINLTVANPIQRDSIIKSILDFFNKKLKDINETDIFEKVSKFNHEIWFYPNKKNPKTKQFSLVKIHFTKANAIKDLNKINSDITEYCVAFILKLIEVFGKTNSKVKEFLKLDNTQKFLDFIRNDFDIFKDVSSSNELNTLINGISANVDHPIIKSKIDDGLKLAKFALDSINQNDRLKNTKITNFKQKVDTADVETYINGKRIGYSVKADYIDNSAHSLKDFSVLKFVNLYPEFKKVLDSVSFDKFIKYVKNNEKLYTHNNNFELTVNDYGRWMALPNILQNLEKSINEHKDVYADILKIVFNLDSTDTVLLTLSGIDDPKANNGSQNILTSVINSLKENNQTVIQLAKKENNTKTVKCIINSSKSKISFNMIFGSGANKTFKDEIWKDIPDNKIPEFVPIYIKFNTLEISK